MKKLNYTKLMANDASVLGEKTNYLNQKVVFLEHPSYGDEYPVIVAFPEHGVAFNSEFYDIEDMDGIEDYDPIYDKFKDKLVFYFELA